MAAFVDKNDVVWAEEYRKKLGVLVFNFFPRQLAEEAEGKV